MRFEDLKQNLENLQQDQGVRIVLPDRSISGGRFFLNVDRSGAGFSVFVHTGDTRQLSSENSLYLKTFEDVWSWAEKHAQECRTTLEVATFEVA